jgi:hypothetical protein
VTGPTSVRVMAKRRRAPRSPHPERDLNPTAFSRILDELCCRTSARAAALVDAEGETVDYGGLLAPFDVRVLAAELQLLQQHLSRTAVLGSSFELVIRARKKSYLLQVLPEGYSLVLELPRRASRVSERALSVCIRRLCEEAGFEAPRRFAGGWREIEVQELPGGSRRPTGAVVNGVQASLIVLGRLAPLILTRERGFRVRLGTGQEGNLVREPLGRWYLEEDD